MCLCCGHCLQGLEEVLQSADTQLKAVQQKADSLIKSRHPASSTIQVTTELEINELKQFQNSLACAELLETLETFLVICIGFLYKSE